MALIDRSLQFLYKCKQLQQQNNLQKLIIPDKYIEPRSSLPYQQIMASQYAIALKDDTIESNCIKSLQNISLPIAYAIFTKILKSNNIELAEHFLHSVLKQSNGANINKHVLIFNQAKLSSMRGNFKKSSLYCESLLKQSGFGSDYYTYQFINALINQNRNNQAYLLAERHLKLPNEKHKIQTAFIYLIANSHEKTQVVGLKAIDRIFGNKKVCIRNYFNIALLLKNKLPQKSLQMFKKLVQYCKKHNFEKIQLMSYINILQLNQNFLEPKSLQKLPKLKLKLILQQCQQIANFLQQKIQLNAQFQQRKSKILNEIKSINNQIRKQNNINFFQAINFKQNKIHKSSDNQGELQQIQSQADQNKQNNKNAQNSTQSKFYKVKRAQNQKRLNFLLKKQKQLRQFFEKLKIQRKGQKLNIKLIDQSINHRDIKTFDHNSIQEIQTIQSKFEQRKKKFRVMYQEGQVNNIINDFVEQWMVPTQNLPARVKNIESIKKFVITLQKQGQQKFQNQQSNKNNKIQKLCNLTNRTVISQSKRSSSKGNTFRVKNNLTRKNTDRIFQGLKNNDHISVQIMNNLKTNVAQRKKQQKAIHNQNQMEKKSFKQKLHQGQLLQQNGKLEQAHEHYVQMYKKFKEDRQKQMLLLKIAENFENLNFIYQAEKTYTKCTKYNNTQAFFKLGLLQIKSGKIQIGIQNLEKANCIDRHNSKIQIKLVYAYSLLQQTTDRALALANSILKRNPQCIQALIMTSKILQKKGKLKESLDIALAIGSNCGTGPTFHYIGLLYLNDSNVNQAFKFFHKAIQCQPDHLPSMIELATILSQARPKQAIDILKNVLSMDPTNQLAFARLGKIYESLQNDFQNALIVYKKGLQYSPSYENYVKIGDCHLKLGSLTEAFLNYKQALLIRKTPQVYQKIAEVHQLQHQDKKAIQAYSMALSQLPKDNSCFAKRKKYLFKLGKLSLQGQQYQTAHGYLSEVADMQQSFEVFKMLGQACYGKGDYSQALHYYEQAATMESEDNLQLLESIAMCFDKQEQYLTSKEIYQKILSVDPKNIRCLNNLANIFLILGKTNEAFYWFEFMLQQAPTSIDKRLRVADIYATIGDWSKVQQHLIACYKLKQNDIRILQRMVNLYKEKRDTKQLNKFQKRLALIKGNTKNS